MDSTLLKGLHILEVLVESAHPRGVSELAADLGLARSNVHRVLKTLEAAGYVRHAPGASTYVPTLKVWEMGVRVHARLDIASEAGPAIAELARLTHETVHLSVLVGEEVVYVAKRDSPEPVRAYSSLGGRAPAHCVATGKVLLAYRDAPPPGAEDGTLLGFTPRTLTTRADLQAALADVRARGYAVNWGEWRDRVRGVAAPIRDARGQVVAAIGISGPAERLTRARIAEVTPCVVAAAREVSIALGGGGFTTGEVGGRGPRAAARPGAMGKRPDEGQARSE